LGQDEQPTVEVDDLERVLVHGGEELGGQDRTWCPDGADATVGEDADPVGVRGGEGQVVQHGHDRVTGGC